MTELSTSTPEKVLNTDEVNSERCILHVCTSCRPPGAPQLQHKIHKPTDAIDAEDLISIFEAWGHEVQNNDIEQYFREN